VKVVARTLRDAGMDVVYTGLHRTPDVDVLLHRGIHVNEKGANDMIVVAGGVMPDEDVVELKKMGVKEAPLQDTPPQAIVQSLERLVNERGPR